MIRISLLFLPQEKYPDKEIDKKTLDVYQHIYSNYYRAVKKYIYDHSSLELDFLYTSPDDFVIFLTSNKILFFVRTELSLKK